MRERIILLLVSVVAVSLGMVGVVSTSEYTPGLPMTWVEWLCPLDPSVTSTLDWNRTPHGGSDEKSNNSPPQPVE